METMTLKYLGELRCEAQHLKSGNIVITDAPTDNNGKGEAFSPTDLMCTSLCACMMTLMGITANAKDIAIGHVTAGIEKIMASEPRRVSGINIRFDFEEKTFSNREKEILKNAAMTCPVAKSIHPDIQVNAEFVW
ncbi:MAG: OsmC family protein [Flavobacteriales bacterium]|jgi:putative redox protein